MVDFKDNQTERGELHQQPPAPDHNVTGDDEMAVPKSTKSPAFQFYPRDFLSSDNVDRMSMTERGCYITLMSKYWLAGDLPSDLAELAAMCRMRTSQFERLWAHGTLHLCFQERNGRLVQRRLETERKKQAEYHKKQAENGSKGGRPKKAVGNSSGTQIETHSKPKETSSSAFASSSASAPAGEIRPAPIIARRRKDAAFEGPRVYVPQRAHSDFVALRQGAEKELYAWYEAVSNEWTDGARRTEEPGPDMFAFWKARYAEKWPTTKVDPRVPAWAR